MKNTERLQLRNKFWEQYSPYTSKEDNPFNAFRCALNAGYTYGTSRNITKTKWFRSKGFIVKKTLIDMKERECIERYKHNMYLLRTGQISVYRK